MDSSFNNSTTSFMSTPTPLDRKSMNSTSFSSSSKNSNPYGNNNNSTTKAVRFQSSPPTIPIDITRGTNYSTPNRVLPSPPNRQSLTPPRSNSTPLPRYPLVPLSNSIAALPKLMTPKSSTSPLNKRNLSEVKIVNRVEVARRLRINSFLMLLWWVASKTSLYPYLASHLVVILPVLDTPLHFFESISFVLLFFNVAEATIKLNTLSSVLHQPTTESFHQQKSMTPLSRFTSPLVKSSPKTRASPAMSPSPTITKSFTPTTTTNNQSQNSPLRQSSAHESNSNSTQSPIINNNTTPRKRSTLIMGDESPIGNSTTSSSVMTAFLARNSPVASNLHKSISASNIDSLLATQL